MAKIGMRSGTGVGTMTSSLVVHLSITVYVFVVL